MVNMVSWEIIIYSTRSNTTIYQANNFQKKPLCLTIPFRGVSEFDNPLSLPFIYQSHLMWIFIANYLKYTILALANTFFNVSVLDILYQAFYVFFMSIQQQACKCRFNIVQLVSSIVLLQLNLPFKKHMIEQHSLLIKRPCC